MRYKGRYTYLGLDMPNSRVTREQGRESKDIHYGLGLTAVMLVRNKAGERSCKRCVQTGVSERSLAAQSGE